MGVEGGMKCVKYLLFFFNFIFWLCGLTLIVLGVLVQVAVHNTVVINNVSASSAPIVLIVVGVVVFFIAFFGCCGAWKESYCMVTMFSLLLGLIIITEIGNFGPGTNSVPDSCCVNDTAGCGQGAMEDSSKVHQMGCQTVVEELLKKNIMWVIVAALVIAFLQIMGIIFACMLMRGIRSGYEVM
uniref:CD63 antigen n=1 Tax=Oncorhynchus kisutch TaxID=8019 RepID=A0A8C7FTR3_ONCKI